jgi:hypothetical protein
MNIVQLQKRLNQVLKNLPDYKPIDEDGVYGNATKKAVFLFQAKESIAADGIVGPVTLQHLFPEDQQEETTIYLRPIPAIEPVFKNIAYRAMQHMQAQIGLREATGKNDGPGVETILRTVGLTKGNSWCMAEVVWAFKEAMFDLKIEALPIKLTGSCMQQYFFCKDHAGKPGYENLTVIDAATGSPMVGDIFIIDLGHGYGHTGMITGLNNDGTLKTVEGNTNDNGSANGDGCYKHVNRKREQMFAYIRVSS